MQVTGLLADLADLAAGRERGAHRLARAGRSAHRPGGRSRADPCPATALEVQLSVRFAARSRRRPDQSTASVGALADARCASAARTGPLRRHSALPAQRLTEAPVPRHPTARAARPGLSGELGQIRRALGCRNCLAVDPYPGRTHPVEMAGFRPHPVVTLDHERTQGRAVLHQRAAGLKQLLRGAHERVVRNVSVQVCAGCERGPGGRGSGVDHGAVLPCGGGIQNSDGCATAAGRIASRAAADWSWSVMLWRDQGR
jgi:hypothetical protein